MTARLRAGSPKMANPEWGGLPSHEPYPMRVGLDVDDVLLELTSRWLELYNEKWDDNLERHDVRTWNINEFVRPECGKKIYDFLTPSIYEGVEAVEGAVEFVQAIRDLGHIPVYVSSCVPPSKESATAWAKKGRLVELGIALPSDEFIAGRDKSNAPVDFLLDDGLHNIEEFRNGLAIIFDQPWNRHGLFPYSRARSYDDALSFIDIYARHRPLCEDFS